MRLVKSGGMGAVYEVQHTENDKTWALKLMHWQLARDPGARERFKVEAKVDGLINSKFIVSVTDSGVDEPTDTPYLVMEFLNGEDLGERIDRAGPCSMQEVVTYLGQVAHALDKAHAKGVVHRDLKLENLFLCRSDEEEDRIKILDFGIAKVLKTGAPEPPTRATGAGRGVTFAGSAWFMAPEQAGQGSGIGPWTDVWALGLIAYNLLVGKSYWRAETDAGFLLELVSSDARVPASERAAQSGIVLPKTFDAWFFRCIDNDPNKRFASAGEAIATLAAALSLTIAASSPALPGTLSMNEPLAALPGTVLAAQVLTEPSWRPGGTQLATGPITQTPSSPLSSSAVAKVGAGNLAPARKTPRRVPMLLVGGVAVIAVAGLGIVLISAKRVPRIPTAPPAPSGMVPVPGGTFLMGSPNGEGVADEHPLHEVTVAAFEMDVTEVTVSAYSACVQSGQCTAAADGGGCNYGKSDKSNHPINCVDWAQAATYCHAHGKRLPTEEEWEYAARGGAEERKYSWGNAAPDFQLCWSGISKRDGTCAVGSFAPGAFGLVDMTGNVWEWTSSGYSEDYDKNRADAARVRRGGGQSSQSTRALGGANRARSAPSFLSPDLGVRCAR